MSWRTHNNNGGVSIIVTLFKNFVWWIWLCGLFYVNGIFNFERPKETVK